MSPSGSLTSLHFLASRPYSINLVTTVSSDDIPMFFLKTDTFPLCISMEFLPYPSFDASQFPLAEVPTEVEDEGAH